MVICIIDYNHNNNVLNTPNIKHDCKQLLREEEHAKNGMFAVRGLQHGDHE